MRTGYVRATISEHSVQVSHVRATILKLSCQNRHLEQSCKENHIKTVSHDFQNILSSLIDMSPTVICEFSAYTVLTVHNSRTIIYLINKNQAFFFYIIIIIIKFLSIKIPR